MKKSYRLENLDTNVKRHFDRNVSRCLIRALGISLLVGSVLAAGVFLFFDSRWMTLSIFAGVSLLGLNITFVTMVPSQSARKRSHALIMAAAKDPERIDDLRPGVCSVQTDDGEVHELNAVEQQAWKELVVPFLCKLHSQTLSDQKMVNGHVLTKSEMRQLREQRKAVKEDEARIKKDRRELDERRQGISELQERLASEENELQQARQDIELQAQSLESAENLVISKLSEIEVAEAQMEQMRENLESQKSVGESSVVDDDHLKRKEAELDALRLSLQEDKYFVEQQKTELNQLKGDLIRASDTEAHSELSPEDSLRIRERELEAQLSKLKEATSELESRSKYVQDVEDSLIERLNAMSEREAFIEQGEVNVGLRADA